MRRGLLIVLACCAVGCGDKAAKPAAPKTPATSAQALVLARVLEANLQHGGARFTATLEIAGQPALANGRVDFRSGRGTAVLRPADATQGPARRYFWTRRFVLAQTTPGARDYAREPPNSAADPVHAMIGFVNLLAAETIDNTANITDQDARLIRRTNIDGEGVDEYRFGRDGGTTLWVRRDDGLLRRIRTNRVTGGLTVDHATHEPIAIHLPPSKDG